MGLTISVIKETAQGETRVAATPDTVKKYVAMGAKVVIEAGAGLSAAVTDDAFKDAGATIAKDAFAAIQDADVVLCVRKPEADTIERMRKGAVLIGQLDPHNFKDSVARFERIAGSAVALELVPRITRAQSMDVLSSQANLAGYRAVIEAASAYGRAFPMMMTAAGTVAPAKAFIMGAGVAGLQAIATARRLGAVVSATDVRMASKEQVESLGASFVMVENEETKQAETAGGYAREMSDDYKRQQAALIAETIKKQDIVITTALIPGRPAPVLVTEDMVKTMKPGSIIVDMAAAMGGNCTLTEKDKIVVKHGVTIIGHSNLPGHIAVDSSALYARNILNLLTLMLGTEKTAITFDFEDEIIKGVTLVHDGKAVHKLLVPEESKPKKEAPKKEPEKKDAAKDATKDEGVPKAPADPKSSFKRKTGEATSETKEDK